MCMCVTVEYYKDVHLFTIINLNLDIFRKDLIFFIFSFSLSFTFIMCS